MIKINSIEYTPTFIKEFKTLCGEIKNMFVEKEQLFRTEPIHLSLNTHKFDDLLDDIYTFSVTNNYKVVFVAGKKGDMTFISVLTS